MLIGPLYILSLGLSAGLVGVLGRHVLAGLGYVPGFSAGLMLAAGIACGFAALQLLYVALLRLLKPTHSGVPWFAETLSNAGAAFLVPYLLGMDLPLPPRVPEKLEVFLFVGAFAVVHGFFKLVSFFGATKARPSERVASLIWFAACGFAVLGCVLAMGTWHQALTASHAAARSAEEMVHVGKACITARRVRENAFTTIDLTGRQGNDVLLGWLAPEGDREKGREVYVTLRPDLPDAAVRQEVVPLDRDGWAILRLAGDSLPMEAERCTVMWSTERQPAWVTEMGLQPAEESEREMLLWGPRFPLPRDRAKTPGIIVLLVEGLGAEQVGFQGYNRKTTPRLDAFADRALVFENAYTMAPEGAAVVWSVMTGLSPLAHGYLNGHRGVLPEEVVMLAEVFRRRGYLTAAFTEGEEPGEPDLYWGGGLERGFDWFDPAYPVERTRGKLRPGAAGPRRHGGSRHTLNRARAWAQAHGGDPFLMAIRLSELRTPVARGRYGRGYMGQQVNPRAIDIHDTAIRNVDEQIGRFLDEIAKIPDSERWSILIAGTHGLDFTEPGRGTWRRDGPGIPALSESGLHVPLLLRVPGKKAARRPEMVSLDSLMPTILDLGGVELPQATRGRNLLERHFAADPVAVTGSPLKIALRSRKWLFTWNTGLNPRNGERLGAPGQGVVFDVERYRANLAQIPQVTHSKGLAATFRGRLTEYLGAFFEVDNRTVVKGP